eukprot:TRINITY_DN12079_c0_g1_i1.p1 TRINITY_DN12079_c0_g1~~TRINITY_DN12079_c0_g1_i1.p1  ORF type:complete len:139 (-),score=13.88 TRINITY_DN12079_c0_g1_i1:394-810(-)
MDEKIKFDRWADAESALKKTNQKSKDYVPLLAILFANTWNPTALYVAKELDKLRKETKYAHIFIIDSEEAQTACQLFKLTAAPSLMLFLDDKPFTIRRSDWADDDKFVGSISKTNLVEILQYAKSAASDGHNVLYLDF